jgi:hypothetical protein
LPFFTWNLVVHLQFLKPAIDPSLYHRKALCQLHIVGFEDGSFVQFLPSIVGFHGRSLNWEVTVAIRLPFGNSSSVPMRGTDVLEDFLDDARAPPLALSRPAFPARSLVDW